MARPTSRMLLPAATLVIGVALGLFLSSDRPPSAQPLLALGDSGVDHGVKLVDGPAAKLGADLMSRVGRRFVASYSDGNIAHGVTFYDMPKPFDRALCRVNTYRIPPKVVAGAWPKDGEAFWDDDVEVGIAYTAWTSPSHPDGNEQRAKAACAAFRDFGNTFISDDKLYPERGPALLDILLKIARSGERAPFAIDCIYIDSPDPRAKGRPCDGRAILRQWSLKQLRQVMAQPRRDENGGYAHQDMLIMATASFRDVHSISVESWEPALFRMTSPTDIRRATVIVGKECTC